MGRWFGKGLAIAGIWGGVGATAFAVGEIAVMLGAFAAVATIFVAVVGE
jgi:hypothetical protein